MKEQQMEQLKELFPCHSERLPVATYEKTVGNIRDLVPIPDGKSFFTKIHLHPEFEILHFLSGHGYMEIGSDGNAVPFSAGDLILVNPFEAHLGIYEDQGEICAHRCVDFSVTLLGNQFSVSSRQLASDLLSQNVFCVNRIPGDSPEASKLIDLFETIFEVSSGEKPNELLMLSAFYQFFGKLQEMGLVQERKKGDGKKVNVDFYRKVFSFVEKHYSEQILTRDVAQSLRYSKEHFCRLFKQSFSVSFSDYLMQFRIDRAKRLLADHSSSEVAQMCGFSEQSNFSKVFRERTGFTPTQFRKNNYEKNGFLSEHEKKGDNGTTLC